MLFLSLLLFSCSGEERIENLNEDNIEAVKNKESEENKINDINNPQNNEMRNNRGGGQGGIDKTNDEVLQNLIKTEVPKFKQFTYTDENSGIIIEYNLFIPNNYDVNKKYPMVQFIPDASLFGKDTKSQLTQGYGGLVWTTDEAQSKNECFVYVSAFSSGLKKEYPSLNTRMDSVVDDDYNVPEGVVSNNEHMYSFDYAYKTDAAREYLFTKRKTNNTERAKLYFEIAANSGNDDATGVKEAKVELEKLK